MQKEARWGHAQAISVVVDLSPPLHPCSRAPIPPNPPDPSQLGGRAVPGLSNVFKKKIAVMVLVRDDVKLHTDVCVLRVGKEHMLINPRDVTRTDSAGWGA